LSDEEESSGEEEVVGDLLETFLDILRENISRSRLMTDLWAKDLYKDIDAGVPMERFAELYRIISFDIMENILTIVPPEEAMVIATNMDHFLQIELLNKRFDIDIMDRFQKEFVAEHGDTFGDQEGFSELVARFEAEWANSPKDYLDGMTPNQALNRTFSEWLEQWDTGTGASDGRDPKRDSTDAATG